MEPETVFYLLSYHGGAGAWNRRQVFTCFRTMVEWVHGTEDGFLLAFVPRGGGVWNF